VATLNSEQVLEPTTQHSQTSFPMNEHEAESLFEI